VIRVAFWGLIALDLAGVLLLFLLGLAAAGSARTNPVQVTLLLLVLPCIPLAAAVVLFVRSTAPAWRLVALVLAAAPLLIAVSSRAIAEVQLRANTNEQGELTFFRSGPMREIAEAIARNDSSTVAALARTVDVNSTGMSDMTLLVVAMRQLRRTPEQQAALRLLLEAGADPNKGAQYELPLAIAIQVAGKTGPEPVKLLLDAGAKPNLATSFGVPVYFSATGQSSSLETLTMLLDRGADVNAMGPKGETALFSAAATRNWKAALLLLERGADWKRGRSVNGLPFTSLIDGYVGSEGSDAAFADVRRYLRQH
jgi:ankyrin repeat protein